MKYTKKILILCTMVIALLIYGCSIEQPDKNNIENKPENNINEQIDDEVNINSNPDKDDNNTNNKPEENEENQSQNKKQKIIIANEYITNDNKDGITILDNKLKDINRESVIKSKDVSNAAIMIYSDDKLTDIRIHKLGEEFVNMDFDIEKYLVKYIEYDYVKVLDKLDTNEGLILEVWESEGIPSECVTYRDSLGNLKYYLIQYNGKG